MSPFLAVFAVVMIICSLLIKKAPKSILWHLFYICTRQILMGCSTQFFKQSFRRTVLYSFLLSLFFETSQLTALFGIYPGPYRLADVEDLICNTMGGAVGYQIAYVFVAILPKREQIDAESIAQGRYISGPRRIWSAFFDYVCSYLLFLFIDGAVTLLIPEAAKYEEVGWARIWTVFCIYWDYFATGIASCCFVGGIFCFF